MTTDTAIVKAPAPTLGSLYLRFRTWSQHGMTAAYYRDLVRPRILNTAPIRGTTGGPCELHALTSAADWLNLVWSLKTFYHFSERRYALCIHDDGSVPAQGLHQLRHHFPDARLIERAEADARLNRELRPYRRSQEFRASNPLALKVFDFRAYLNSPRLLLFDSDLLFFKKPQALLDRLENPAYHPNTFNADLASGYTVTPELVQQCCGFALQERINSGLALVHRDALCWDSIETFLALPGLGEGHFWRIEQTLYALCASRWGVELLPEPDYGVCLEPGIGARPVRHYVGRIRHRMYSEGMSHLCRQGFLNQLTTGS